MIGFGPTEGFLQPPANFTLAVPVKWAAPHNWRLNLRIALARTNPQEAQHAEKLFRQNTRPRIVRVRGVVSHHFPTFSIGFTGYLALLNSLRLRPCW